MNVFEANMLPSEFCDRYSDQLAALSIHEGDPIMMVQQARTALDLQERDVVQGQHKVN